MKELRLTGIMYPPPQQFDIANPRTLQHECEEFVSSELDALVEQMKGLPLLVEHCDTELVGTVERARKTSSGAVEIEAVIKASCQQGRVAIDDILNKRLVGLSLSHEYKLSAQPGSSTAQAIRLNLVDGKDWTALTNTRGHEIRKTLREVSLCLEPRRYGCDISSVICASVKKQHLNRINASNVSGRSTDKVVGVFSCSASAMQSNDVPTSEVNNVSVDKVPVDKVKVDDVKVDGVKVDDVPAPLEQPKEHDNTPEQVPADAECIMNMQKTMQAAVDKIEEMKTSHAKQAEEQEERIKKLLTAKEKEQTLSTTQIQKISELEKQISQKKSDELKSARAQRDSTFERLSKTLVSMDCQVGTDKSKSSSQQDQLAFESSIAEAAIKQLVSASDRVDTMNNENRDLKRRHETIGNTLSNFNGNSGVIPLAEVRVDASANANKRQTLGVQESYIAWRKANPGTLKWKVDEKFREIQKARAGTVVVNASAGKWQETDDNNVTGLHDTPSMYSDHPDMAQSMSLRNLGKMISGDETLEMMRSINTQNGRSRYPSR